MQRNHGLDIAKGIGIVFVVWAHASCPISKEINTFHMPLFFFLSGLLFKENLSIKELFLKKTQSLIIPYFLFLIICEGAFVLLSYLTNKMDRVYISPGLLIHPWGVLGPLWFLLSLFEVTMAIAIIVRLVKKPAIQFLIVLFLSYLSYMLSDSDYKLPLYLDSSLSMLVFFYLGFMLAKSKFLNDKLWQWWIGLVMTVIFLIGIKSGVILIVVRNVIRGNYILYLLTAISGTLVTLYASRFIDRNSVFWGNLFAYLGRNSLYIFVFHLFVFELVLAIFKVDAFTTSYDLSIYIAVVSIAMSLLFATGFKKALPAVFK
jgi:fucose 4-O-acetylase-like acetyltransferase